MYKILFKWILELLEAEFESKQNFVYDFLLMLDAKKRMNEIKTRLSKSCFLFKYCCLENLLFVYFS